MNSEIPEVCVSDFTVRYVPKKEMPKIRHKNAIVRDKAIKTHVKEVKIKDYPITLNSKNEMPTANTKKRILKTIWINNAIKGNFENFAVYIKDIKVKCRLGRVSYKFNYEID